MASSLNIATATAALIVAAANLGKTLTEDEARALVKTHNVKSNKRVLEVAEKAAKPKATRRIRSERVISAGPRGFRFTSKAWLDSVKAAEGIAVHPSNINKLKAHAKAMGVSAAGNDMVAMAKLITEAGLTPPEAAEEAAAE